VILMAAEKPFPRTIPTPPKVGLIELRDDAPFSTLNPDRRNLSIPITTSSRQIRPGAHLNSFLPLAPQRTATQ
jgi:hypothetical protein